MIKDEVPGNNSRNLGKGLYARVIKLSNTHK